MAKEGGAMPKFIAFLAVNWYKYRFKYVFLELLVFYFTHFKLVYVNFHVISLVNTVTHNYLLVYYNIIHYHSLIIIFFW